MSVLEKYLKFKFLPVITTVAALTAPTFAGAQTDRAAQDGSLGDIVVTARRTSEQLQKTPVAVTALTGETLTQRNVTDIYALQFSAPNLSVSPLIFNSGAAVTIRGQVNVENQSNSDPAVAIYVDGVYVARSSGGLMDLVDVERVEVLRGPQGTLFGRNTTGGALNIVTPDPTGEFGGFLTGTYGNYDLFEASGALNVPIAGDEAGLRISFKHSQNSGYGRNAYLNTRLADMNKEFVRAKLKIAPDGAAWSLLLSGDYSEWENNGPVAALIAVRPGSPATNLPIVAPVRPGDTLGNYISNDFYTSYAGNSTPSKNKVWGGSAILDVDLGGVQFKSTSALRGTDVNYFTDNDGTPYIVIATEAELKQKYQLTQELQLSGGNDNLSWIGGLFYFDEKNEDGNPFLLNLSPIGPPTGINQAFTRNRSIAGYAQATYKITPELRITGGLRYTQDKRKVDLRNRRVNGTCILNTVDVAGTCRATQKGTFDYLSYTLGLDYQAADDLFLYAKTSRAYRAGGFNIRSIGPSFEPERVTDYEFGFKADIVPRRLRANVAAFYSDFNNVQRTVNIVDQFSGNTSALIQNAAKASLMGVELEVNAMPIPGLELSGNLGYTEPSYGRYVDPASGADLSGTPYTYLSRVSYNVGATYTAPVGFGDLIAHVDYGFQSRRYFAANPGLYDLDGQAGFGLLNGRLTVRLEEPAIDVALWGRNIANKKYDTYRLDFYNALGTVIAFRGTPRTYGISATYRF